MEGSARSPAEDQFRIYPRDSRKPELFQSLVREPVVYQPADPREVGTGEQKTELACCTSAVAGKAFSGHPGTFAKNCESGGETGIDSLLFQNAIVLEIRSFQF